VAARDMMDHAGSATDGQFHFVFRTCTSCADQTTNSDLAMYICIDLIP
jgi:hypothetical protein